MFASRSAGAAEEGAGAERFGRRRAGRGSGRQRTGASGGGAGNAQTDFNEQRLIYKGRLDPSGEQQGLRRRDPRGPRRRLGPDGREHSGH